MTNYQKILNTNLYDFLMGINDTMMKSEYNECFCLMPHLTNNPNHQCSHSGVCDLCFQEWLHTKYR